MNAYLVRLHPVGIDRVPVARIDKEVSVGWGKAGSRLSDPSLDRIAFGQIVHDAYCAADDDRRRCGRATGNLWRFIRAMRPGDLLLVPHGDELHLAQVTGEVTYDRSPAAEHWAYRRTVRWLTEERGVPRTEASDALRRRARVQLTCLDISDLVADVQALS